MSEENSKPAPDTDPDPLRDFRDQRHNEPKSGGWRKILGKPQPPPDEPLEPEYLFSGA